MGMFDTIMVEYPLPDGHDPNGGWYQTKDLECFLYTYTLTRDGRVFLDVRDIGFHGELCFYASNVSACSSAGVMTGDNKPPVFREYVALFKNGQLIDISGGVTDAYADAKHYTDRKQWWNDSNSPNENSEKNKVIKEETTSWRNTH